MHLNVKYYTHNVQDVIECRHCTLFKDVTLNFYINSLSKV